MILFIVQEYLLELSKMIAGFGMEGKIGFWPPKKETRYFLPNEDRKGF